MKRPNKASSLLNGVKFFFESFFEGIQYVFKRLITVTGMLFALCSVFGATQIYEHMFKAAPAVVPDEINATADDSNNQANLIAPQNTNRAPASALAISGQSRDSGGTSSSYGSNGSDSSPTLNEPSNNSITRQPTGTASSNGVRNSGSYGSESTASSAPGKNPAPKKDSSNPDSDAGTIPLVGNLPKASPTPQAPVGTNGIAPSGPPGSIAFRTIAQTSSVTSGGGVSRSAQLMVEAAIGEIPSPLIQKAAGLQIINGLTGTQN